MFPLHNKIILTKYLLNRGHCPVDCRLRSSVGNGDPER